jgi:cell division protein FtsA
MNEKNIKVFIDFGSSKIRLGVFSREISKDIFISEQDCISNFSLNKFDINSSKEVIKNLIKSAEKKIDTHIKNINLMIDTPDIFCIDFSIKKNSDKKKFSKNDIHSLLNEAKSIVQKNYINQKIIHAIVKKFVFDGHEFFEIPIKEINYNSLEIELKFICFSNKIWKNLEKSFNSNYLKIDNLYCSSYVKSVNYNSIIDNYKRKAFLDIGYGKSAITIFEGKRILYFSILPVGGKHITNDVASLLKINLDEAENFKKSLNQSETKFIKNFNKNDEIKPKEFMNQIIFARVDEIIKLNLTEEYFNALLNNNDDNCILVFIGNGSKILNKNSIYLEDKFVFFKEICFFEENSKSICQSGFNFIQMNKSQEVNFVPKKPRNKGFFEKFFHLFN